MLRATLVYVFVGLYILGTAPIGLIWTHIAGDTSLLYVLARACIRISGWMAGIRVMVRGREHLQSDQAYLFLSNHQANLDGPILCHATQRNCRAVIKKLLNGKTIGLLSAWGVMFITSIPYLWAVGASGQNLGSALFYLFLFGTPVVLGFGIGVDGRP